MPEAALAAERDAASKGHRWSEIEQLRHEVDVEEGRRLGHQVPEHALGVCKVDPLLPGLPQVRCSRRSEERRVGKECVSTCRSRWSQYHLNKKHAEHKLRRQYCN